MSFTKLQQENETLRNEFAICRRKLDSKCEALLILSKDLDQCRQGRDQFKLMAEQVQARYQAMKRQLAGVGPRQASFEGTDFADMKQQNLTQLLCEMREVNKALQFEVDDLKQKLGDGQGDIKLLREQIARQRVGTTDEGINTRHFPAHEREELVKQLEEAREQYLQVERDLQQVLDEKEELVTERDVYKNKYDRLNTELNFILKGDEKRIVDIDALSMENRYLQERLKQMEEEKSMAMATVSKYKSILERKKNKGIIRLGQSRSGGVVISQKQVQQLLETKSILTPTPKMMTDLQSLASALLETLNDKNMALSHQRKTNKILGGRVGELEKKVKTLEVAGLWSVPDRVNGLEKLRQEVKEIQTLIPTSTSAAHQEERFAIHQRAVAVTLQDTEESDIDTPVLSPQSEEKRSLLGNLGLSLEDLDLLPTKEGVTPDCIHKGMIRSPSEGSEYSMDTTALLGSLDIHSESQPAMSLVSLTGEGDSSDKSPDANQPDDHDDLGAGELSALLEKATMKVIGQDWLKAGESGDWNQERDQDLLHNSETPSENGLPPQNGERLTSGNSQDSPRCTSPLLSDGEDKIEDLS